MNSKKILFVVNPIAGGKSKQPFLKLLAEHSLEFDYSFSVYKTRGQDDFPRIAAVIEDFEPDTVVAVGGDGTVNALAKYFFQQNIALQLGIIPYGSANGLATDLNIPKNDRRALDVIIKGIPQKTDGILINEEHLALHIADLGLNAKIVKRFEEAESRGMFGYVRQFFREFRLSRPAKFKIKTEEGTYKEKAHMIGIANSQKYGTGALINPLGKIDDGKFELCIFKPFPRTAFLSIFLKFFTGKLPESPYVRYLSVSEAELFMKPRTTLQVDGEVIGELKTLKARILPKAFTLMIPQPEDTWFSRIFASAKNQTSEPREALSKEAADDVRKKEE